jgi:hypothetical protein
VTDLAGSQVTDLHVFTLCDVSGVLGGVKGCLTDGDQRVAVEVTHLECGYNLPGSLSAALR